MAHPRAPVTHICATGDLVPAPGPRSGTRDSPIPDLCPPSHPSTGGSQCQVWLWRFRGVTRLVPAVTRGGSVPPGALGAWPAPLPVSPHSSWCRGVTVWPPPHWAGTLWGHGVSSVPVAEQTLGHIRWLRAQGRDMHRHGTCLWHPGMAWSHLLHWSCMGLAPHPALSHRRAGAAVTCRCHLSVPLCHLSVPLCHLLLPGRFCAHLSHLLRDEPVKPSQ